MRLSPVQTRLRQLYQNCANILLLTCSILIWQSGCRSGQTGSPPTGRAPSNADTSYQVALKQFLRDSTVIDSLSRLVPTDSLYHLYRAVLVASDPTIVMQQIKCEEFSLRWHYGSLPARDAIARMRDSVYKRNEQELVKRVEERFPEAGMFIVSPKDCGVTGPRAPRGVNGTSLSTRAIIRPPPPK